MIKSMTGFGRCEHVQGDRKFTVEIKAVNHRYFDVNIKMPKKFNFFESAIRSVMKEYIQRGKVDVFITCEDDTENNFSLKYNENIAGEYLKYYRQMAQQFNLKDDVTVSRLGSCPEVFSMEEQMVDEDEIWALLETALRGALKQFVETRTREGENLKNDLIGKLDGMLLDVDAVEKRYPQVLEEYRSRLREKVDSLLADSQMDESRLAAEVILYADKITPAMRAAMDETARRRKIQDDYNKAHGIVPKTIVKSVRDLIEISASPEPAARGKSGVKLTRQERDREIEKLEKKMKEAAKMMEYEYAAVLRDEIIRLRGESTK